MLPARMAFYYHGQSVWKISSQLAHSLLGYRDAWRDIRWRWYFYSFFDDYLPFLLLVSYLISLRVSIRFWFLIGFSLFVENIRYLILYYHSMAITIPICFRYVDFILNALCVILFWGVFTLHTWFRFNIPQCRQSRCLTLHDVEGWR